jgi:type IV pilus assembly protein PilW
MRPANIKFKNQAIAGFTLVELMVALAISSFLIIGATTVYMQGRSTFRISESVARLQEDARYVLEVIEPDLRMASFFGLQSRPTRIANRATSADPVPAGLGVTNDCGTNWSIDLGTPIEAVNNNYTWACAVTVGSAQAGSDALVLRRASEDAVTALQAGVMYLQSARFIDSQLFVGTGIPAGFTATNSETHELVVNGYYVSDASDFSATVPSLRRRTLTTAGGAPVVVDREILAGVEDFQVEFGVDTDALGTANRGSVNLYVNPDDPMIDPDDVGFDPNAQILAVRLWLLVRAQLPENGFTDDRAYAYADRVWVAGELDTRFRRMLVSKTVYLRNARTMM